MFKEFNVKFEDVEILGDGTDSLLEGTEVTKVVLRGENNFSSLDSTLKNCNELDTIDGNLNLKDVTDIDNLLEGTELVTTVNLVNINNENMSVNNPFPNVNEIGLGGDIYNKKALQNVIATKDWTFEGFKYKDNVGKNITTQEMNIVDDNKVTIKDTLEQKARGFEIIGQTYENLVVGSGEVTLLDELTLESIDGSPNEFNPHIEQPVCVEVVEGETYQNLVNGKGEYKLTDTFSSTWTESNNSIDNPPSMIEIPEIWGNTVQGYANCVTAQQIVNSINNSAWTDGNSATLSPTDPKLYKVVSANSNGIDVNSISWIQLKANTTYSVTHYSTVYKRYFNAYVRYYENPSEASIISGSSSFTTGDSGKVFLYPMGYQGQWNWIRVVEGEVDLSQYAYDEMDLNYIQSVGDLYVDEEGTPILDEDGNEQYKLEIESGNDLIRDFRNYDYSLKRLWNGILENHIVKSANVLKNEVQFQMNGNMQGVSILGVKANVLGVYTIRFKYNSSDYSPFIRMNSMKKGAFVEQPTTTIKTDEEGYCYAEFSLSKEFDELRFTLGINACFDASFTHSFSDVVIYLGTGLKINPQSNKTTILMPQPLMKLKKVNNNYSDLSDKLYWDSSANKYYIENNIYKLVIKRVNDSSYNGTFFGDIQLDNVEGFDVSTVYRNTVMPLIQKMTFSGWGVRPTNSDFGVGVYSSGVIRIYGKEGISITPDEMNKFIGDGLDFFVERRTPQIIETKILEKPSLETYSPKTYISTNTEIQPNQMTITNKQTILSPLSLQANTDYTLQLDSIGKDDKPITVNLGGTETTIQPVNDTSTHHKVVIKTPTTLTTDKLELSGEGVVVNDVMLFEGGEDVIKQEVGYVEGIESIGEHYLDYYLNLNEFSNSTHSSYYKLQGRNINVLQMDGRAGSNAVLLDIKNGDYTIDVTDNTIVQIFTASGTWVTQLRNGENINITEPIRVKLSSTNNTYPFTTHFNLIKDNSAYEECYKIDILTNSGKHNLFDNNNVTISGADAISNIFIEVNEGDTYTSFNARKDGWMKFITYNSNKVQVSGALGNIQSDVCTITVPKGIKYIKPVFSSMARTNAMTVKGTTRWDYIPYTPYHETKQSILLPQPLRKIGDIKDKFYWNEDKGHYCIEQNVITINDFSNVDFVVDNYKDKTVGFYSRNIVNDNIGGNGFTNVHTMVSSWGEYSNTDAMVCMVSEKKIFFRIDKTRLETINSAGVKKFLKENNVTLYVQAMPNIIDLLHLNKKYSLDTYIPTTYLQCVDTTIQPSKLLLESDIVRYRPSALETNTDYTVQFECLEKSDKKIKLNLGGSEKEVDAIVGLNHVSITTPNELSKDRLFLSGVGNKVDNVMVVEGSMSQYPTYFDGVQNAGVLEDGKYKIDIKTNEGFVITIKAIKPLVKGDKLYWNKSNKRYEIDRSGEIEIPTVEGNVMDLPRLYQREDTNLTVESGNIKPSEVKIEYLDID